MTMPTERRELLWGMEWAWNQNEHRDMERVFLTVWLAPLPCPRNRFGAVPF